MRRCYYFTHWIFVSTLACAFLAGCGGQNENENEAWTGTITQQDGNTIDIVYDHEAQGDSVHYYFELGSTGRRITLNNVRVQRDSTRDRDFVRFNVRNPAGEEEDCVLPEQTDGSFEGPCVGGPLMGVSTFTMWPTSAQDAPE